MTNDIGEGFLECNMANDGISLYNETHSNITVDQHIQLHLYPKLNISERRNYCYLQSMLYNVLLQISNKFYSKDSEVKNRFVHFAKSTTILQCGQ